MSDTIAVHKDMGSLDVSPQLSTYTKVIVHGKDDGIFSAQNNPNDGLTLELDCPFCESNQVPRRILNRITGGADSTTGRGYQYQPYTAGDMDLDPAAEIGDAISSPLVFGGIYTRSKTFGHLMLSNVSAPSDEELNHEYQFESPEVREFKRETGTLRASLTITNGNISSEVTRATNAESTLSSRIDQTETAISAKVSSTGGDNASFGWTLDANGFYLYSGNKQVMKCDSGGLSVAGNIDGKTGTIGDFTIKGGALYTNNMETMQSTQTTGLHLSKNGIKIGQNFSAAAGGTVTATNINLKGSITFYNSDGTLAGSLSAANLKTGAEQAYNNHSTWSGTSSAWTGATGSANALNRPTYFNATNLYCDSIYCNNAAGNASLSLRGHKHSLTADAYGNVTMGEPVPYSYTASFNMADTSFYKNGVSAAIRNAYLYEFRKSYEYAGKTYFYIEIRNSSDSSYFKTFVPYINGSFQ